MKLHNVKLSRENYRKQFDKDIEKHMHAAAREWLLAVYPLVPVWTGMARGSLIPLGAFLNVPIPIDRNPSADAHGLIDRGFWDGIPLGKFQFRFTRTQFRFHFSTDVEHYMENELNVAPSYLHLINPTPWHSFEAGAEAFKAYVESTLIPGLPKIKKYFAKYVAYETHVPF